MLGFVAQLLWQRNKDKKRKANIGTAVAALKNPYPGDDELAAASTRMQAGDWAPIAGLLASRPEPASVRSAFLGNDIPTQAVARWAATDDNSTAYAMLANARVRDAWEIRGSGRANTVQEDSWGSFFDGLREAEQAAAVAIERDPNDDAAWAALLNSGRGLQVSKDELRHRFSQAHARRPFSRDACSSMLQGLCAKWSGSHEEMFEFARWIQTEAPAGSPTRGAIAQAHSEKYIDGERGWLDRPEVREEIANELQAFLAATPASPSGDDLLVLNELVAVLRPWDKRSATLAQEAMRRIANRPVNRAWAYFGEELGFYDRTVEWEKSLPKLIKKG